MRIKNIITKPRSFLSRLNTHNWHKHPLVIPVTTLIGLFFISLVGFVLTNSRPVRASDSHTVILSHDKQRVTLPTRADTVGDFLNRSGVALNEGDVVEPATDTKIVDDNFRVNVYRARPVIIFDGDHKVAAFSAATTPRSVAQQSGITVYPEDTVKTEMQDNFLDDGAIGQKVVIDRAIPATLNLYGTSVPVRTHAKTVGDLLKEKSVVLGKDDTVQPSQDTPLTEESQVFVVRSGTQVTTSEEVIPMETQIVQDSSLSLGATAVRQAGSPGKKLVTYQIELKNGVEISRHVIQEVIAQQPVTQITARGKTVDVSGDKEAIMAAAGIAPSDYGYVNYIVSHESGWRTTAANNSGAYGLCQALPGSKMASAGADWQSNPVTQLRWCSSYAARKGGWAAAYEFWISHHWW